MDLFFHSISVLINHLFTGNGALESPVRLLNRSAMRQILMVVAAFSALLIFLVSGLWLILLDLLFTSRETLSLQVSPVSLVGALLMSFSILGTWTLFSRRTWRLRSWQQPTSPPGNHETSPLQQAVAELLRDFVEERRLARELALQQTLRTEADPNSPF
jgi:hypothetical protein